MMMVVVVVHILKGRRDNTVAQNKNDMKFRF